MDRILSFLGMCKKAGALEIGEEPAGAATRRGLTSIILIASDAAENTAQRAANYAEYGKVELAKLPYTKDELGEALGKRVCAVLAVTDLGMATSFAEKLSAEHEEYKELSGRLAARLERLKNRKNGGSAAKSQGKSKKGGM